MSSILNIANIHPGFNSNVVEPDLNEPQGPLYIEEIVRHIFEYLSYIDLSHCKNVCRHWRIYTPFVFGPEEWENHFNIRIINFPELPTQKEGSSLTRDIKILIPGDVSEKQFLSLLATKGIKCKIRNNDNTFWRQKPYWIEVPRRFIRSTSRDLSEDSCRSEEGAAPAALEAFIAFGVYYLVTNQHLSDEQTVCYGTHSSYTSNYYDEFVLAPFYSIVGINKEHEIRISECYYSYIDDVPLMSINRYPQYYS